MVGPARSRTNGRHAGNRGPAGRRFEDRIRGVPRARHRLHAADLAIYGVLATVAAVTIYPFWNVIAVSVSSYSAYLENPLLVIPREPSIQAYRFVLAHPLIRSSYRNTVFVTVAGTAFRMILITLTAYPLARRGLRGKRVLVTLLVVTLMFNGGLIPNFLLVRKLGLYNTLLALFVPGALSAFHVILMKSFLETVPESLIEAATMDGAPEIVILARIIVPVATPIIATLSLFNAVSLWNSFFSAVVYIRDRGLWTMQLLLREIVVEQTTFLEDPTEFTAEYTPQNLKYGVIVVAMLPILFVYPFLQRYFVKGIVIGSVKG